MSKKIGDVSLGIKIDEGDLKKASGQLDDIKKDSVLKIRADKEEAEKKLSELKKQLEEVKKSGDIKTKIAIEHNIAEVKSHIGTLDEALKNTASAAGGVVEKFSLLARGGLLGGIITGIQSAASMIGGIVRSVTDWVSGFVALGFEAQKMRISFQSMLKDADAGAKLYREIVEFANATPFGEGAAKSARLLVAMGFEAQKIIPTLHAVGDAVAAAGGGDEALQSVARALGQMNAKGKISAEEMNQLAEQGINGFWLLAKATGVAESTLRDLAQSGKLLSSEVMPALISQMGEEFPGAMEKMGKTAGGKFDSIGADIKTMGANVSEFFEPLSSFVADVLGFIVQKLGWLGEKVGIIVELGVAFGNLLTKIPLIGAALSVVVNVGKVFWNFFEGLVNFVGKAFEEIKNTINSLSSAMDAVTAPVRGLFDAISEGSAAFFGLEKSTDSAGQSLEHMREEAQKSRESIQKLAEGTDGAKESVREFGEKMDETEVISEGLAARLEELEAEKRKLHEEFSAGKLSLEAYNKKMQETEAELLAAKAAGETFAQALAIVENHQLSYMERVRQMNGLSLNPSAYNALIAKLRSVADAGLYALKIKAALLEQAVKIDAVGVAKNAFPTANSVLQVAEKFTGAKISGILKNSTEHLRGVMTGELKKTREAIKNEMGEIEKMEKETKKAFTDAKKAEKSPGGSARSRRAAGGGGRAKAEKSQIEEIKKAEKSLEKAREESHKKAEKYQEAESKWAKERQKTAEKIRESLRKIGDEYEKTIEKLNADYTKKREDKIAAYYEKLLEKQAEYAQKSAETVLDPYEYHEKESINAKIEEIKKQFGDAGGIFAEIEKRAKLTESEREHADFLREMAENEENYGEKVRETTNAMMAKKSVFEEQERVMKFVEDLGGMRGLASKQHAEIFAGMLEHNDSKNLLEKMMNERENIQKLSDEKIAAESRFVQEAEGLHKDLHEKQLNFLASQKKEYGELIDKIRAAIAAASELKSLSAGGFGVGFANGGYTGAGGRYEVAGVVHRGEYVIPAPMLENIRSHIPAMIPTLEKIRTGGNVTNSTVNRSVNITGPINVRESIDFERLLENARWRL